MITNEGNLDRAIRQTIGIMMMALGLSGVVAGTIGICLIAVGAWFLLTGTIGWCPIYRWIGWNSLPRKR